MIQFQNQFKIKIIKNQIHSVVEKLLLKNNKLDKDRIQINLIYFQEIIFIMVVGVLFQDIKNILIN